jgi:hypothetical protein
MSELEGEKPKGQMQKKKKQKKKIQKKLFLEKINKIDKLLVKLIKRKW